MGNNRSRKIKCAFCDWSIPVWTKVGGVSQHGTRRLKFHVIDRHPEEWEKIKQYTGNEEPENEPAQFEDVARIDNNYDEGGIEI